MHLLSGIGEEKDSCYPFETFSIMDNLEKAFERPNLISRFGKVLELVFTKILCLNLF